MMAKGSLTDAQHIGELREIASDGAKSSPNMKQAGSGVGAPSGPDHCEPDKGIRAMADHSLYTESDGSGNDETWQSLGDVAQRLVRKAGAQ